MWLTDYAGNGTVAVEVSSTVTDRTQTVYLDRAAPLISGVSITTDNTFDSTHTHTKVGDTITLIFSASDGVSGLNGGPVVSLAGHSITRGGPIGTYGGVPAYTVTYKLEDHRILPMMMPSSPTVSRRRTTRWAPNTTSAGQTSVIKFYESLPTVTPETIASTTNPHPAWASRAITYG